MATDCEVVIVPSCDPLAFQLMENDEGQMYIFINDKKLINTAIGVMWMLNGQN